MRTDAVNCVERVAQRAPMQRDTLEERNGPSLTVCGQLDKKSLIPKQREAKTQVGEFELELHFLLYFFNIAKKKSFSGLVTKVFSYQVILIFLHI